MKYPKYPTHILLDMLREPCGETDCGHCELERQAADEIERLRAENAAMKAQLDELHDLLDLVQADGSIHDLDLFDEERMDTTLGKVLCGLMKRLEIAERVWPRASKRTRWGISMERRVEKRGGIAVEIPVRVLRRWELPEVGT